MTDKRIIVIAGPNGAGKTSFAKALLPFEEGIERFINADMIAQGLSPFAPEKVAMRAGKILIEEMHEAVRLGESFAIETTLSGNNYRNWMRDWRQYGYYVVLHYLSLPSAEVSLERVALRRSQGGHNIPEADILRRYQRSVDNFEAFKSTVNEWICYDARLIPPTVLSRSTL